MQLNWEQLETEGRALGVVRPLPMRLEGDFLNGVLGALAQAGARTFVVGGAVRDFCWTHDLSGIKDMDFEVYGMDYEQLLAKLSQFGKCSLVGKSFGVVKFTDPKTGDTFDFSVPRRDNKSGVAHTDFTVEFPTLTPKEASARRDFTVNSLMFDPLTGLLWDYYGGEVDLRDRWLRHTSEAFSEDPLRVLRGMQLSSRFESRLALETAELCCSIADQYHTLPKERVWEEWYKWATRSSEPVRMFDYLRDSGWLAHFSEIIALQGVPQDPEWHPEGPVFEHTYCVVNAAGEIAKRDGLIGEDKATLLFTALCHDFAKPQTTKLRMKADGQERWTAYGHEEAGGPVARTFMERIGAPKALTERVVTLTVNHMKHIQFKDGVGKQVKNVRTLATNLGSATIRELVRVMEADCSGRPPLPQQVPPTAVKMRDLAEANGCLDGPLLPCILGRDLLERGLVPGPVVGKWVRKAFQAQLNGTFSTREEALGWLDRQFSGRKNRQDGQNPSCEEINHD